MHARTVTLQVRAGYLDETVSLFRDTIQPEIQERKGVKGGMLMVDRRRGKVVSLTFWETEEDMRADEAGAFLASRIARLEPFLTSLTIAERFEVVSRF